MSDFPRKRAKQLKTLFNALFAALIAFVLLFGAIRYMIVEIWGGGQSIESLLWEVLPAVAALLFAWLFTGLLLRSRIFRPLKDLKDTLFGLSGELSEGKIPDRAATSRELQEIRDELCRQSDELLKLMRYTQSKLGEEVSAREKAEFSRRIFQETVPEAISLSGAGYSLSGGIFRGSELFFDYLDAFRIDESTVFFAIGDIWGGGLNAAFFLSRLKNELREGVLSGKLLAEVMIGLNSSLFRDNPSQIGATLFAGIFNAATRELHFVNMGQFAPVALGGIPEYLRIRTGSPLGLYENVTVYEESVLLSPGQGLVFCSEGVMSAAGEKDRGFGFRRMLGIANSYAREEKAAEKILEAAGVRAREDAAATLILRCEETAGDMRPERDLYRDLLLKSGNGR